MLLFFLKFCIFIRMVEDSEKRPTGGVNGVDSMSNGFE